MGENSSNFLALVLDQFYNSEFILGRTGLVFGPGMGLLGLANTLFAFSEQILFFNLNPSNLIF